MQLKKLLYPFFFLSLSLKAGIEVETFRMDLCIVEAKYT